MVYSKIVNASRHTHEADKNTKYKARVLRRNLTDQEKILWNYLRRGTQSGFYFRRQHPYGIYILDFYCFRANLVIEVDGPIHLKRNEYDIERTEYLTSSGLKVLRFTNQQIEENILKVLKEINVYLIEIINNYHFPFGGNKKGGYSYNNKIKQIRTAAFYYQTVIQHFVLQFH